MEPDSLETVGDTSGCIDVIRTVENLPDEILLQVFELFTHEEKLTQLSLVCRHWQELAQDPSLYRKLVFTQTQPSSTRMAVKLVKMAPWLVSLDINMRVDADEILRHVGINTPCLKVFGLLFCKVTLQSLHNLKNCSELREIRLYFFDSDDYNELWLSIVKVCQEVEKVQCYKISGTALTMMCNKFKLSLKELKIMHRSDTDEASMLAVASCTNMTTLLLGNAFAFRISDVSLISIGGMPNLVDLSISGAYSTTTEGWTRLFRMPILKRLTKLTLYHCEGINDDVARAMMKNSEVLEYLWFSFIGISALTLEEVKQLISHLKLVYLCIEGDGIHISAEDGVYD